MGRLIYESKSTSMSINIKTGMILEDVPAARKWLEDILIEAFAGIEVKCVATLKQAMLLVENTEYAAPNIALIDLSLPDGCGISMIEHLARVSPDTLCVVSTIYDDDEHVFPALQAGAHGYLLKDQERSSFIERLKGIVSGEPPLSPSIARRLLRHFSAAPTVISHSLTDREIEVLTLIAKGLKLITVSEMLGISRHTVAGYVKEIYRKLNISSRAEATIEASRLGLIESR